MKQFTIQLFGLLCIMLLCACDDEIRELPDESQCMRPVYSQNDDWKEVAVEETRQAMRLGEEIINANVAYREDRQFGIHVTDVSDPLLPRPMAFIKVPGLHTFDIRGDSLFAGNFVDAVVFDVSDAQNITLLGRVANTYSNDGLAQIPLDYSGFLECPDESNGEIIGWYRDEIDNPQCWK